MTERRWDVALIGEIYIDHIFSGLPRWPSIGEEVFARGYARELGGGVANTACALGRLGRNVLVAAVVGSAEASWIGARFADFDVAAEGLQVCDDPTGITVGLSMTDDRTFFSHTGANRQLAAWTGQAGTQAMLATARHVHIAMPIARNVAATLLPFLRSRACSVTLDVGHHPAWLSDPDNVATMAEVDLFLPNMVEAACLTGTPGADAYRDFAARHGLGTACVKLGADGAMAVRHGLRFDAAPPPVPVVDTTGAGDAFDAGLIDALLDGGDPAEMIRRGCIVGALSTRAAGALAALPTRPEVEQRHG